MNHFALALALAWIAPASGRATGKPQLLARAPRVDDRLLVTFASENPNEQGQLAALDLEDGAVLWNIKVKTPSILHAVGDLVLGSSGLGNLDAWNASTGAVAWSKSLEGRIFDIISPDPGDDGSEVIVASAGGVELIHAVSGQTRWRVEAPHRFFAASLNKESRDLCVAGVSMLEDGSASATSVRIDAATGKMLGHSMRLPETLVDAIEGDNLFSTVGGGKAVALNGESLELHDLCGDHLAKKWGKPEIFDLSAVRTAPPVLQNFLLPWPHSPGLFVGSNGAFSFFFRSGPKDEKGSSLGFAWINNAVGPVSAVYVAGPAGAALDGRAMTVVPRKDELEMRIVGDNEAEPVTFKNPAGGAKPDKVLGWEMGSGKGYAFALIMEDASLLLVEGGQVVWAHKGDDKDEL